MTRTILLIIVSILFFNCSKNANFAGATSETTNGVALMGIYNNETPATNAKYYLYKAHFLPTEIRDSIVGTVETNGEIITPRLEKVDYNIEIVDSENNRALGEIVYDAQKDQHYVKDTAQLILKPTGKMFGEIVGLIENQPATIQIFGLNRITTTDSLGYFYFDSLPEGQVIIHISMNDTSLIERDTVIVTSNESTNCGIYRIHRAYYYDSIIVRNFLDVNNLTKIKVEDIVTKKDKNGIKKVLIKNKVIDTIPNAFFTLPLINLSMTGCSIDKIPATINYLNQLEYLDLTNNNISTLPNTISELDSCYELDLANNELSTLPQSIMNLKNLNKLYVNKNHLIDLSEDIINWIDSHSIDDAWLKTQTEK